VQALRQEIAESSSSSPITKTLSENEVKTMIVKLLHAHHAASKRRSEAVKLVTNELQVPKSIVYHLSLQIPDW
jgi:hypothetical protein